MNELTRKVMANLAARAENSAPGSAAGGGRGLWGPDGGKYAALRGAGKDAAGSRNPARDPVCNPARDPMRGAESALPRHDAPELRYAAPRPERWDADGTRMAEKAKALHAALRGESVRGGGKRGAGNEAHPGSHPGSHPGAHPGEGVPGSGAARDVRYAVAGMVRLGDLAAVKK